MVDHLNGLVLVAIAIVSLLAAIYAKTMVDREIPVAKHAPFYALFLLQVTGLFGMTVTGDMFNLYVLLEIASFSAYAMIGMGEGAAPFAAFRYMIFGTLGACAYLLGVGYLYMITGSLNMADLRQILVPLYQSPVLFVGFAFLLVGTAVKMALFPVHTWLPDSYTLAPSSVSVLLAPLFTKVGAYVLIRVLFTVFDPSFSTHPPAGHPGARLDRGRRHPLFQHHGPCPDRSQADALLPDRHGDRLHRDRRRLRQPDGPDRVDLSHRERHVHDGASLYGRGSHTGAFPDPEYP